MKRFFLGLLAAFILPATASAVDALPASSGGQTFYVSTSLSDTTGARANPSIYNIEDSTYFKLRDLGRLMNFAVSYDARTNAVHISPDAAYVPVLGESLTIQNTATTTANAVSSVQTLYLSGKRITPTVYNIKGNNYISLRELGKLVDFGVSYNYDNKRITAYSEYPYAAESTWSAAMNDLAGNLSILPPANFSATAKRYAPIVTGQKNADWTHLVSALRAVREAPPIAIDSLHRTNLYWADRLTAAITNSDVSATPRLDTSLTALADADLFANPDKAVLERDFRAMSSAYLSTTPAAAANAAVSNSISKDARARLTLSDDYAAARGATDADEKAAKAYFASDMAALSALTADSDRVNKIYSLLQREFRTGSGSFWTRAYNKNGSMDSFSFAAAADWMFAEAGIPAFIARGYSSAWNVVYVNRQWAVFEYAKGASLRSLDDYRLSDTHPASTLLLTQVMRPGGSYYNTSRATVNHYFTYTAISGKATATAAQMQAYVKARNPSVAQSVLDMIPHYLTEGADEGIRGDVAFAQSCLETGNFKFEGSAVTLEQNNFCGLAVVTTGVTGASFDTPQLGIRAQIQHLKAYASRQGLVNDCIDPRFSLVTRGCAEYVQHLGIQENPNGYGWASGADYGTKILNILDNILTYPTA